MCFKICTKFCLFVEYFIELSIYNLIQELFFNNNYIKIDT